MTEIHVFLNGEQKTVEDTATIKDLLPNQPEGTSVVLLLPGSVSREKNPASSSDDDRRGYRNRTCEKNDIPFIDGRGEGESACPLR